MRDEITKVLPALRRFAYSLTGSMPDADDLLQNTVERLLTRDMPAGVELAKWSFRVCRNLWIDEYRASKVRHAAAHSPELLDEQIVDGERSIYKEIELSQVNSAMASLSEDQRAILSLVAVQGLSYKEVAETLDIPTGTVMSRLARARTALCQYLNESAARTTA